MHGYSVNDNNADDDDGDYWAGFIGPISHVIGRAVIAELSLQNDPTSDQLPYQIHCRLPYDVMWVPLHTSLYQWPQ